MTGFILLAAFAVVAVLLACDRTRRAVTRTVTLLFVAGVLLVIAALIGIGLHYG